jgi:putative endonuclease
VIKLYYIYILECADTSLYTGWTSDVEKRLATHSKGKGAKYTRARLPVKLAYFEEYEDKISAQKREYQIKQLSRKDKLLLIQQNK